MKLLPLDGCRGELHTDVVTPAEADEAYAFLDGVERLKACECEMADGTRSPIDVGICFLGTAQVLESGEFHNELVWREVWPSCIEQFLPRVESIAGRRLPICLVCYYRNGTKAGVYHADPPLYGDTSVLTTLSLGAARTFGFRSVQDRTQEYRLELPPRSLLVMREGCQQLYEHAALADEPDCKPRFSLSFRMFGFEKPSLASTPP